LCASFGDPHLSTLDGLDYDFQGKGDFIITRSSVLRSNPDFQMQARFLPCRTGATATCGVAAAMKLGANTVTAYMRSTESETGPVLEVFVNGAAVALPTSDSDSVRFPGAAAGGITKTYTKYKISFDVKFGFEFTNPGYASNSIYFFLPGSTYFGNRTEGLCGTWDGTPNNDLRYFSGAAVMYLDPNTASNDQIYTNLQTAWRVTEATSLFDYTRAGASYTQTNDPNFQPSHTATFASPALETQAREICNGFQGMSPRQIQACLFDVAATGDLSFARASIEATMDLCAQASGDASACTQGLMTCPNFCNYAGKCVNSRCECFPGFQGTDCATVVGPGTGAAAHTTVSMVFVAILALVTMLM
jgi:hypothetical protein